MQSLNQIIAQIVDDLIAKRHIEQHTQTLKRLSSKAVPELLKYIDSEEHRVRLVGFYALQYCWSEQALSYVAKYLAHQENEVRENAAIVIARGAGLTVLAKNCESLIFHPNREVSLFALEHVEAELPDIDRTRLLLVDQQRRYGLWKYLPRYYCSSISDTTLKFFHDSMAQQQYGVARQCLAALIHQKAVFKEVTTLVVDLLKHPDGALREYAAEYLSWHGNIGNLATLKEALRVEQDVYSRAALIGAVNIIKTREHRLVAENTMDVDEIRQRMEPHFAYREQTIDPLWVKKSLRFYQRLAAQYGFTHQLTEALETDNSEFLQDESTCFIPPVRDYFNPRRNSFGKHVGEDAVGFRELVHVGDDCAWFCDHQSVVAVADGLVREVSCIASWGIYVVIEHRLTAQAIERLKGQFSTSINSFNRVLANQLIVSGQNLYICSLYAHLGPSLWVKPGQTVKKGEKIGVVGRSFCYENGGYNAHLHFAIHLGPYWQTYKAGAVIDVKFAGERYRGVVKSSQPHQTAVKISDSGVSRTVYKNTSWVTGYISEKAYLADNHGWLDPPLFLSLLC